MATETTFEEYRAAAEAAAQGFARAKSIQDAKDVWGAHLGILGHRALGRLLMGTTTPDRLADKFADRE